MKFHLMMFRECAEGKQAQLLNIKELSFGALSPDTSWVLPWCVLTIEPHQDQYHIQTFTVDCMILG